MNEESDCCVSLKTFDYWIEILSDAAFFHREQINIARITKIALQRIFVLQGYLSAY